VRGPTEPGARDGKGGGEAGQLELADTVLRCTPRRYSNIQKGTFFLFVLETQGCLHARGRWLLRNLPGCRLTHAWLVP